MRLCAIYDGFEASDVDMAVYGPLHSAFEHPKFMRTYSAKVTLVQSDDAQVDADLHQRAKACDIALMKKSLDLLLDGKRCGFVDANGKRRNFDTVYPVLGTRSQATLAIALGVNVDEDDAQVRRRWASICG